MRDPDPSFGQDGRQIPIREPVGDVPAAAKFNDVGVEGTPTVNRISIDRLCRLSPPQSIEG